jgi:hypothetical protein
MLSEVEQRRLDRNDVIVRTLPGGDGQLAVVAAPRLNAHPDALAAWTRSIAALKRSPAVLAVQAWALRARLESGAPPVEPPR